MPLSRRYWDRENRSMQDALDADMVELTFDKETGKVWLNIDGRCAVRVGHADKIYLGDKLLYPKREK